MSAAVIATASDRIPIGEYISPKWRSSCSVKDKFIGTWKLVSWKVEQAAEVIDSPLGSNPLGWIMYQPGGRVCVALMRPDRPKFASNNLVEATPEEIKAGFEGYMGYCGSYEVNERERFIIHHLELSWFPNWVETDQKRYFEFTGNRLTLKTPPVTFLGARFQMFADDPGTGLVVPRTPTDQRYGTLNRRPMGVMEWSNSGWRGA